MEWDCPAGGHKYGHTQEVIKGKGMLAGISVKNWCAAFHMIIMARTWEPFSSIRRALGDLYGISASENDKTITRWLNAYQSDLKEAVDLADERRIGGPKETVVYELRRHRLECTRESEQAPIAQELLHDRRQ